MTQLTKTQIYNACCEARSALALRVVVNFPKEFSNEGQSRERFNNTGHLSQLIQNAIRAIDLLQSEVSRGDDFPLLSHVIQE